MISLSKLLQTADVTLESGDDNLWYGSLFSEGKEIKLVLVGKNPLPFDITKGLQNISNKVNQMMKFMTHELYT